jgi:predicted choloylglycine hydrolase
LNEEIILKDTKEKIATDALNLAYRNLKLDYDNLVKAHKTVTEENKKYRKQNKQFQVIVDTQIRSDLEAKIFSTGNYKKSDLEDKEIEDLQTIAETLSRSKGVDSVFKSIRAGTASKSEARNTVGNLYGKSRKEILEMGGDF